MTPDKDSSNVDITPQNGGESVRRASEYVCEYEENVIGSQTLSSGVVSNVMGPPRVIRKERIVRCADCEWYMPVGEVLPNAGTCMRDPNSRAQYFLTFENAFCSFGRSPVEVFDEDEND